MSTRRGKQVQEALRGERFTKSVVRVKLSPAEMVRILREKSALRVHPAVLLFPGRDVAKESAA